MRKTLNILFAAVLVLSFSLVATTPVAANGPPSTTGLVLHLDASDAGSVIKDGANRVSQWSDLSGAGNHATQAMLANQPRWVDDGLGGKPAIRFDGADDYLTVSDDAALEPSNISVFIVMRATSWLEAATCLLTKRTAFGNGYMLMRVASTTDVWFDWGGSGVNRWQTGYQPALDTPIMLSVSRDADGRYLHVDGYPEAETTHAGNSALVPTASDLYIGRDSYLDQYYLAGNIAEILIYDRALSDGERQAVEQYLGRKWLGWGTACIATATGSGTACLTTSDGVMENLTAVAAPGLPSVSFPHGMFSFQITGLTAGQTVDVTITLPAPVPVGTLWWKYDNGRWHGLPNLNDNGDHIMVIRLTDGGAGDLDSILGQITDPGGPGNPMTVGIDGSPVSKAGVMAPWIALLAIMMAGASLLVWRRRRVEI